MNRRQFVLSWGRKLFFGLCWPLFSLIGLIYLQSFIFPQTTMESFYFITSFIGLYGGLCTLAYFILYCPIVLIFPTYYFSRLWSLIVIILISSFLFFDACVFSQYRLHLNMFFLNLIYQQGITSFVSSKSIIILFVIATFVGSIVIWFRGNMSWRQMQKRFSNPVANWYLVLILVSFGISHLCRIYSSQSLERMRTLFPVNYALSGSFENKPVKDVGRLYYPKEDLKCNGKGQPNIVFIVIKNLNQAVLTSDMSNTIPHMQNHGYVYQNHFSGGTSQEGGLFSLIYSLPATYADAFRREQTAPVFFNELTKRKYQPVSFFQSQDKTDSLFSYFNPQVIQSDIIETWKSWIVQRTSTDPLFAFFYLDEINADINTKAILLSMLSSHVLKDTTFVITGDHGSDLADVEVSHAKVATPLIIIWPHRAHKSFNHFTSHYDVIPTLMRELWNCKSAYSNYSIGKSLNDPPEHSWHMIEVENDFALMDMQKSNFTRITSHGGFDVKDFAGQELPASRGRTELTLKALRDNFKFYKR